MFHIIDPITLIDISVGVIILAFPLLSSPYNALKPFIIFEYVSALN
jgi:hypothetical protein